MTGWSHVVFAAGLALMIGMTGLEAAAAPSGCSDPLPIDPQAVVTAMGWKSYRGGQQAGPVCSLQWETKSGEMINVLMYGPTALQTLGVPVTSTKAAADRYKGEGPKGVEAVPGAPDVYTVFDPKGPNRRVFVTYRGRVYMINITGEVLSVAALVKALLRS